MWSAQVSTRPSAPFSAAEQRAPDISLTGPNAALTILITIGGHRYGLQYSGTLIGPWQNHGAVQTGDGSPLQLTAPVSAGVPRRFYRVLIER